MLSELVKGILPGGWRRYTVPRGCTVIQWITDFSHRVSQLQEVSRLVSQGGAKEIKVCLFNLLYNYFYYIKLFLSIVIIFSEFSCLAWRIIKS